MTDNIFKADNDKFIDFLHNLSNSRIPWIQRKEISAWSAILLLYAILWSISSFLNSSDSINNSKIDQIIMLIFIYAICYIFFRFIHAQYSSIYNMSATTNVIRKIIFIFCEKNNSYFQINRISNYESFQNQIRKDVNSELHEVQQFRGEYHPIKIVLYLWIPIIYKWINKSKIKWGTYEKAEASIYSLIIISIIYYTYIFLKNIIK